MKPDAGRRLVWGATLVALIGAGPVRSQTAPARTTEVRKPAISPPGHERAESLPDQQSAAGGQRSAVSSSRNQEPGACLDISIFDVSLDGKNRAWAGSYRNGRDTVFAVWLNDTLVTVADSVIDLQYSSSGRLCFAATRESQGYVYFDNRAGPLFERINHRSITVSPDGTSIAYAAARSGKWRMVSQRSGQTVEGRAYDGVGLPLFSADGATVIYPAFEGQQFASAERFVVVGTREFRKYDCDYLGWLKPSPDGRKLAWVVSENDKAFTVESDLSDSSQVRIGSKYDDIGWLEFIPGSSVLTYAAKAHGQYFLVRDGYPLRDRWEDISFPTFRPDGRKMAFVVREDNQQFVIAGDLRGPRFDEVVLPEFSPDCRRLGYIARQGGKWCVVIEGRAGKLYDEVAWLTWSPDGTSWACRARVGNQYRVVVNGREGPLFDDICRLWFSRDGTRIGYGARQGRTILTTGLELR